ncbi:hypothetical protein [Massilia genomosp. 1]|uniref:Uncharacterized protein n=1 Tax=Massilia genomosp. 1 TaxID=2609280 RepID=A0ABX0MV82_9BURK|nr:hypothetical protein [Massilia genomosp. 1]NHZ66630.1 hypothetical protein [Massilia genomosp. 1]
MTTKKTASLSGDEIREKLARVSKNKTSPIIQEVAKVEPTKKVGRKKHRLEGVEYARISAGIPVHLKTEMNIAILTTHKEFPTIDTFIAEAVRVFLSMKK